VTRLERAARLLLPLIVVLTILPYTVSSAGARQWADFGTFYRATCGPGLYTEDPDSVMLGVRYRNLSPPHFHLVLLPLCRFPIGDAFILWTFVTVASLVASAWIVERTAHYRWPAWATTAAAASGATTNLIITGQVTGALAVPLVLAWRADRQNRLWAAGLWLGVVAAIKPFFGVVVLWWMARRAWAAVAGVGCAMTASFAAGVVFYGWPNLLAWIRELQAVSWPWAITNASAWGPWARTFGPSVYLTPLVDWPAVRIGGTAVTLVAVAIGTALALRRTSNRDVGWVLCLSAALLLSPLGWAYYGWWLLLLLPLVPVPTTAWLAAALTWALPSTELLALVRASAVLTATLGSAYTYGLMVIWASLVTQTLRRGQRRASTSS
jgi:hypothetical protein